MNRNEERKNASKAYSQDYPIQEYCETEGCCFPNHELTEEIFEEGAIWADEHPRQGLWDSEKVIEWLRNNQRGFILTDMDITDLRKAMEVENDTEL